VDRDNAKGIIYVTSEAGTIAPGHKIESENMSNQGLLVIIVVGVVAGWLAGQIMRGAGYGLIGDLIVGIIGAYIGDWLLPRLGIHLGAGIIADIIDATVGALVLLFILRLVFGGGGWGGWRRRW
jgi:uncharacterized membrane protein YeaQ/YmgE (transglycosylase-associated protein family)